MSQAFERAVKRGDARLFDDVTLRNQCAALDANGDPKQDSYGTIVWASATEVQVPAELAYSGEPTFERRADGIDEDIDVLAWVTEPDTYVYNESTYGTGPYSGLRITDGAYSEARRATRLIADGETYVIRDVFKERNGRLRGHGERE